MKQTLHKKKEIEKGEGLSDKSKSVFIRESLPLHIDSRDCYFIYEDSYVHCRKKNHVLI